ncbi:DUF5710 domain-containing protein [Pseudomonas sp. 4810-S13]|uniref:DUF5710 domain-containing protein n=1 Tax=Pseudomonas sp. 4810-S13 TaxID=3120822 RepID=UPI0031B6EC4A
MQIRFGLNALELKKHNQVQVIWDSEKLVNGHTLLVGMSGAGKTFLLRKMISHMLQTSGSAVPRIHVFDIHGDLEIPGASEVRFSERSNWGLNPLRVNPDPHFGGIRKRVQAFISTIERSMRAMGTKQEACLRNLLLDVYAQYGFKQDDPSTWVVEEETAVIMTDGHEDRLFIDVPKAEKDEAKALGARWSGGPLYSWYVAQDQYQGAITRWPPKLMARTHPCVKDVLRMAQNIHQQSFLGTSAEAVSYLEVANRAAAAYRKKAIQALRKGEANFEDEAAKVDLDKAKAKAIDSFTTYVEAITTGRELTSLMKYDSTDVLKSVVDRLQNLDAIGIFKSVQPPFHESNPVWRYHLQALSMTERKLFVLFRLEEIFLAAVERGPQDRIRDVIILDEAHVFADESDDNIINTIAKEARKFGLMLVAASQSPTHFPQDFVASVATKVVLGIDEIFWKPSATKLRLREDALAWVTPTKTMLVQLKMKGETQNDWHWCSIA